MVINLENDEISVRVKNTKRPKLFVDTEIPDAAALRMAFFEFDLKDIPREKILFGFEILFEKAASFEIGRDSL